MRYGYGVDYSYLILVLPALLFTLWAQFRVKSAFAKYKQVPSDRNMTGADAARLVLEQNGVSGVTVTRIAGELTDHYDPKENVIRLSQSVYDARTAAAVGVAAHEAGHAVQYAHPSAGGGDPGHEDRDLRRVAPVCSWAGHVRGCSAAGGDHSVLGMRAVSAPDPAGGDQRQPESGEGP